MCWTLGGLTEDTREPPKECQNDVKDKILTASLNVGNGRWKEDGEKGEDGVG